jgi:hypothetical protein
LSEWLTGTTGREKVSLRVSISGDGTFRWRDDWKMKPLYQYCCIWREKEERKPWPVIFFLRDRMMVMREYRKPLKKRSGLKV